MASLTFPKGPLPPEYFTADRSGVLLGVGIMFITVEVVAFGLRIVARKIKGVKFGWDDILMILALLCNLAVCTVCLLSLRWGVGKHTLAVIREDPTWPEVAHKHNSATLLVALPIAFMSAVTFSKLAILHLFYRIFKFGFARYMIIVVAAITILTVVVTHTVTLMQCIPLSSIWSSIVREHCIDIWAFFRYSAIPNVATDVIMLIMPLPQIWKLRAPRRVKVGILVTLLTASIGIVSSVVRLVEIVRTDFFADPQWYCVNLLAFTMAEGGTLFLAACLVTYRPLLRRITGERRLFSRIWPSHRLGSDSKHSSQSSKVQERATPVKERKPVRGFDSLLLSAVSRDDNTRNESSSEVNLPPLARHISPV